VAEVVGGDLAELVVVDGEDAVGGVEIVEVSSLAALGKGTELGGDQLSWLEGEHVGGTGLPVSCCGEAPSIERRGGWYVVEVDLDLESPRGAVDAGGGETLGKPTPSGRRMRRDSQTKLRGDRTEGGAHGPHVVVGDRQVVCDVVEVLAVAKSCRKEQLVQARSTSPREAVA
jgi:hypothetical protein